MEGVGLFGPNKNIVLFPLTSFRKQAAYCSTVQLQDGTDIRPK